MGVWLPRSVFRRLAQLWLAYGFAALAAERAAAALAQTWPTVLVAGVLGGLCFAALGWATMRA